MVDLVGTALTAAAAARAAGAAEDVFDAQEYDDNYEPDKKDNPRPVVSESVASDLAAQTTMIAGGDQETYHNNRQEILERGQSSDQETIQQSLKSDYQQSVVDTASVLAAEGEIAPEVLTKVAQQRLQEKPPSMEDVISDNAVAAYDPLTKEAREVFGTWQAEDFEEEKEALGDMNKQLQKTYEDFSLSWSMAGDFLLSMVPFYETTMLSELADEFEVEKSVSDYVFPGEMMKKIKTKMEALPPQERVDAMRDMSVFLSENAGLFTGNQFLEVVTMMDIWGDVSANTDPENIEWERWLLDFSGAMDFAMVVGSAAKGVSAVVKANNIANTLLGRVVHANPTEGAKVAGLAAKSDEMAEAVGETSESLRVKSVLPKPPSHSTADTPEVVRDAVRYNDAQEEVLSRSSRIREAAEETGEEFLRKTDLELEQAVGGKAWIADSRIDRTGSGWKVQAGPWERAEKIRASGKADKASSLERTASGWRVESLVGASRESGWSTRKAAQKANKELFDGKAVVVSRRLKTDELRPGVTRAKEHFLRIRQEEKMTMVNEDFGIATGARGVGYLLDADSRMGKNITRMANASFDQYKAMEKGLESFYVKAATLGSNEQTTLGKVLTRSLEREHTFTPAELRRIIRDDLGYTGNKADEIVEAYADARRGFDTMYMLENRIFHDNLAKDGYTGVIRAGDEVVDIAKPLGLTEASSVKRVYNPLTKEIEDISDIATKYKNNQQMVELRNYKTIGNERVKYMMLDEGKGLDVIPEMILNYKEGWMPTRYLDNYFVTKTSKVIENGKEVPATTVVGVARTKQEAVRFANNLQSSNVDEGVEYAMKSDRALSSSQVEEAFGELAHKHGQMFFSKRGARLKYEDGTLGRIENPLEAAINSSRTVSRRAGMSQFIDGLRTKYINEFGDLLPQKGTFSAPVRPSAGGLNDKQFNRAKELFNYINHLDGMSDINQSYRLNMLRFAETVDGWGPVWSKQMGDRIRWFAENANSPIGTARGFNFTVNLGTDPLRQMILQPTQIAFMSGLDPMGVVKHFDIGRTVSKLAQDSKYANLTTADFEEIVSSLRFKKIYGINAKELKGLVEEFRASGLGLAVTSHQTARDAAKGLSFSSDLGAVAKTYKTAVNPLSKGVGVLRKGFERGEEINLGAHYMFTRSRWMKNNPGKNPADFITQIAGEARSMSLSMTQPGDFAYQKGFMSVPMQYFSIRHKTLSAMTTSQQFTKGEKARLALGQLGLWGIGGWGLDDLTDWASREYGVTAPEVLRDGLVETFTNTALTTMMSEDVDLDISGSFGLLDGIGQDNLLWSVYEGFRDKAIDPSSIAFGATSSNLDRLNNFRKSMAMTFNADLNNVLNEDMTLVTLEDMASVFSSYNRLAQGYAMLKSGYWQDAKGQNLFEASAVEAVLHGLLGLGSNRQENLYDLQRAIRPSGGAASRKKGLQKVADDYYRVALQLVSEQQALLDSGKPYTEVVDRANALLRLNNVVVANLGPHEANEVMGLVKDRIFKNVKDSKEDELIKSLHKLYNHDSNLNHVDFAAKQGIIDEEEASKIRQVHEHLWRP